MTAHTAAARGARLAERLMTDTCVIIRRSASGSRVYDPESMRYVGDDATTLYSGKCRVKPRDVNDRLVDAGEQPTSLWSFIVSVPLTVRDVTADDEVRVASATDPSLNGRRMRITGVVRGTDITARRLQCVEEEVYQSADAEGFSGYPALDLYPSTTLYPIGA